MYKQKRVLSLSLFIGFISSLTLPVSASKAPSKIFPHEGILRENMAQLLGVEEKKIKLTKTEKATWQDCLAMPESDRTCKTVTRSGFRVIMSGEGENWVYYVKGDGSIILDRRASLNKAIRTTLAKELAIQPNQLQITAAQLFNTTTSCSKNTTNCQPKSTVEWRILTSGRQQVFQLQLNGKLSNFPNISKSWIPENTAKMPREFAVKVLQDVINRDGVISSNLRVESIKATIWNWCQGKGPGPTRPDMGICFNVDQPGWQMIVISARNRYFYYIPQTVIANSSTYLAIPDGIQSLPKSAIETAKIDATKRGGIRSLRFAEPRFFDGCLNIEKQHLSCGNSILPGWQVTFLGTSTQINTPPLKQNSTLIYNMNLAGDIARFAYTSSWLPKP